MYKPCVCPVLLDRFVQHTNTPTQHSTHHPQTHLEIRYTRNHYENPSRVADRITYKYNYQARLQTSC